MGKYHDLAVVDQLQQNRWIIPDEHPIHLACDSRSAQQQRNGVKLALAHRVLDDRKAKLRTA
jgi:hypothetical protein